MRKYFLYFLLLASFSFILSCEPAAEKELSDADKKTEALLLKMTLEEKVGKMTQINITEILIELHC